MHRALGFGVWFLFKDVVGRNKIVRERIMVFSPGSYLPVHIGAYSALMVQGPYGTARVVLVASLP